MNPYVQDADLTLWNGDALTVLRELPAESVHCCVTSPPYWGLRDYGAPGQLGLEETPGQYVAALVEVFREVRRVLRRDGTVWLNLGDSYGGAVLGRNDADRNFTGGGGNKLGSGNPGRQGVANLRSSLKPKDLCMVPARAALALQADGWYLRSQIIWSKPNPMPESVTDRPTTSHEYVFLLAKSPRYFFDQEAVREPAPWDRWGDQTVPKYEGTDTRTGWMKPRTKRELQGYAAHPKANTRPSTSGEEDQGQRRARDGHVPGLTHPGGRNLRSVWEIPTQPYPRAHFATYPEELVRRCILAGTSERGCCPECGAPWVREVEQELVDVQATNNPGQSPHGLQGSRSHPRASVSTSTKGWRSSCRCTLGLSPDEYEDYGFRADPCTVLDPFGGSGTTALVARKHGRRSILIELSESYCELAADRTSQLSLRSEPA